ncbi:MAG TPA: TRAP transporter small permease subunit [bacterium]|nr:TRAP transporter small permease subunit [bacterium]
MRPLLALADVVERAVSRVSLALAACLLPLLLAATVLDVLRRLLPGALGRIYALKPAQAPLFFALVMLTLGYVYLRDGHVRIDALRHRFPPRVTSAIELVGVLGFLLPLCSVLLWFGTAFALDAWRLGETGDDLPDLPVMWLIKATIPAGALLLALAGAVVAVRAAATLAGRPVQRARPPAGSGP